MKVIILWLMAVAGWGQDALTLTAGVPGGVRPDSISISATNRNGASRACYWVIAVYPIGKVNATGPNCIDKLSASSTITVSWGGMQGATSYDVLRYDAGAVLPGSGSLLVGNTGATSLNTTLAGALTAYTVQSAPNPALATIKLNNRDYSTPKLDVGMPLAGSGLPNTTNVLVGDGTGGASASGISKSGSNYTFPGNVGIGTTMLHPTLGSIPIYDWCVSSINGSDYNDGKCDANGPRPFATIAKLLTQTISAGQTIGLERGSVWREQLTLPSGANNVLVDAYGSGAKPHLNAADVISSASWSKTGGYTNVYGASLTITASATNMMNVWRNGTYLKRVADLATLDSTANAYHTTDQTVSPVTISVNVGANPASDGATYEYAKRQAGYDGQTNATTGGTVRGIWTSHNLSGSGSLIVGLNSRVDYVLASDGNRHNVYATPGFVGTHVESARSYDGGNDISAFVANGWSMAGTETFTCTDCTAHHTYLDPGANTYVGSGFGGHSNDGTDFGTFSCTRCAVDYAGKGWNPGDFTRINLTDCRASNITSYAVNTSGTVSTTISGGSFTSVDSAIRLNQDATADATITDATIVTSGAAPTIFWNNRALRIERSIVTAQHANGIGIELSNRAGMSFYARNNTITRQNSGAGVLIQTWTNTVTMDSDYNTYVGGGEPFGGNAFYWAFVSKSFATWKTATGQDANSTVP